MNGPVQSLISLSYHSPSVDGPGVPVYETTLLRNYPQTAKIQFCWIVRWYSNRWCKLHLWLTLDIGGPIQCAMRASKVNSSNATDDKPRASIYLSKQNYSPIAFVPLPANWSYAHVLQGLCVPFNPSKMFYIISYLFQKDLLDRHLGSSVAEMPVKCQSET